MSTPASKNKTYYPPKILSGTRKASPQEEVKTYNFIIEVVKGMVELSKSIPGESHNYHTSGYHFSRLEQFYQFAHYGKTILDNQDTYPSITWHTESSVSFENQLISMTIHVSALLSDKDVELELQKWIAEKRDTLQITTIFMLLSDQKEIKKYILLSSDLGNASKAISGKFNEGAPYHILPSQLDFSDLKFIEKVVNTSSEEFKTKISKLVSTNRGNKTS